MSDTAFTQHTFSPSIFFTPFLPKNVKFLANYFPYGYATFNILHIYPVVIK